MVLVMILVIVVSVVNLVLLGLIMHLMEFWILINYLGFVSIDLFELIN